MQIPVRQGRMGTRVIQSCNNDAQMTFCAAPSMLGDYTGIHVISPQQRLDSPRDMHKIPRNHPESRPVMADASAWVVASPSLIAMRLSE